MKKSGIKIGKRVIVTAGIALGIALLLLIWISVENYIYTNGSAIVARVDGEPVSVREMEAFMKRNRTMVYDYFNKKYNAADSEDFWTREYDGENPLGKIKEDSIEQLKRIKIQEILLKKYGIVEDISYKQFLKELDEENERRKQYIKEGKIIYGPQEYGEDEYFDYLLSNRILRLKEKMQTEQLKVSEEEIRLRYEQDKASLYRISDEIKVGLIKLVYYNSEGNLDQELKDKAVKDMDEILVKLESGQKFEDLAVQYNSDKTMTVKVFDESTARTDEVSFKKMKEMAQGLEVGQISRIFNNSDFEINLIKCIERKKKGYRSFNEQKQTIESMLVDEKLNNLIDDMVKEARIEIDENVYERIKTD